MYKIIQNNNVIDVVEQPKFVKFLPSGHIALTDKGSSHGIAGSDDYTIYSFKQIPDKNYPVVAIDKITTKKEFERLKSLLDSNVVVSADETALAKAKREKISSLSGQCKNLITSGFTIKLSDDHAHSFKLTTEDQLNLAYIENQLNSGERTFIYHATDEPCKIFLRDDMTRIIQAYKKHVLYHTTYFNLAKQYIKALTDMEKINLFKYGDDIIESVDNATLKQIIKNGGPSNES